MKSEKLGGETRDCSQPVPDCMSVTSESEHICHRIFAHPLQNQCLCRNHVLGGGLALVFIVQSTRDCEKYERRVKIVKSTQAPTALIIFIMNEMVEVAMMRL